MSPYTPGHRVCVEEVSEQPGHVSQFVGLQTVNGVVLLRKDRLKTLHVLLLQQTEPLRACKHTHTHTLTCVSVCSCYKLFHMF